MKQRNDSRYPLMRNLVNHPSLYEKAQAESDAHWAAPHTITIDGRELSPELAQWILEAVHSDYHMARAKVLRVGRVKAGADARYSYDRGSELSDFLANA
jgi:hypothetical protein